MSVASRLSPEQVQESEREYVAHRQAVVRMLRREFPRLGDEVEELYHQAWLEFLELRATGTQIDNPRALLQKIAWRAARARLRRRAPEFVEPTHTALGMAPDHAPLPDESAQVHIDADALRAVVESLEPRQAAAIKLRFDLGLSSKEIQRALGVGPKRLEKIVSEAYAELSAQLHQPLAGESAWTKRQRSLLLACEIGLATDRQRRRAQRLVDADPSCRAMLAEMRRTMHDVAAILPVPVLVESDQRQFAVQSALDRLTDLVSGARQGSHELAQRAAPAATTVEQAGGAAGATLFAGTAVKLAAVCVAVGGTATVCLERFAATPERERPVQAQQQSRTLEPLRARSTTVIKPRLAPKVRRSRRLTPARKPTVPVSSPKSSAPASPAPEGSTEFGPGAVGSTSRPTAPAPAPIDGGGEFTP